MEGRTSFYLFFFGKWQSDKAEREKYVKKE